MKPNTYISGNQGFIGKRLTTHLESKGYEVSGCDIRNGVDFASVSDKDIVVHCAAHVSVTESVDNPEKYIDNNILKLVQLIKNNRRIIFLSTGGALYGNKKSAKEEEATLENCTNPYAMSKLVGEWLVRYYCDDYLILRLANVFGEGQDERGEANCLTHFTHDDPIVVYGGEQTRDFIDVSQVVEVIEKGIEKGTQGTYNIGTGEETAVIELAEEMSKKRNVTLKVVEERKGEVDNISLDVTKAQEMGLL